MSFTEIDTNYVGGIPTDTSLVVVERSDVNNESYSPSEIVILFLEALPGRIGTYNLVFRILRSRNKSTTIFYKNRKCFA